MKSIASALACLSALSVATLPALAQCGSEPGLDLLAPGSSIDDFFGESVRTDGTRALAGAYGRDVVGTDSGAAWIWRLATAGWELEGELLPPPAPFYATGDHFGRSGAVHGDLAVVGAYRSSVDAPSAGLAHVYAWSGTSWEHEQVLHSPDPGTQDRFGRIVDLLGERLFVGAPFDTEAGFDAGAAYYFRRVGGSFVYRQKLMPPAPAHDDRFGKAFALGEERVVIGSSRSAVAGDDAGSAFVYRYDAPTDAYELELDLGTLVPLVDGERFGVSVALEGAPGAELCVVGAPHYADAAGDRVGTAYVFRNSASGWSWEGSRLLAADRASGDNFGWSVGVDGGVVVIGAPFEGESGLSRAGKLYAFRKLAGDWRQVLAIEAPLRHANEELGSALAWRSGSLLAGARGFATDAGRVQSFSLHADCVLSHCAETARVPLPCPCANPGGPGAGCGNSTGVGALLSHSGSTSWTAADLALDVVQLPANRPTTFFSGLSHFQAPFGDGLRCAGGSVRRGPVLNSGASGSVLLADALGAGGLCAGPSEIGATRHVQAWYRDPAGPCGLSFNTSNALAVPIGP